MYLGESFDTIPKECEIDPMNYNEVMSNVDAQLWQGFMKVGLKFMYFNKVWELVEVLEEIKPIGCKFIYKRKRRVDGKVETYKTKLIVKGYGKKKPGFDYKETFSPITMLKPIKILLFIMTHLNYEILKMGVKISFLNRNFDEGIYMMQPNGFIAKS